MIFEFLKDAGNYNSRKVGRDSVNGLIVSTAYTSDCGYETAIGDKSHFYPVERYDSQEKAILGHAVWKLKAVNLDEIEELSWLGITDKRIIKLEKIE